MENKTKHNSALRLHSFIGKMIPQQPPTLPLAQVLLNAGDIPKEASQRDKNIALARITTALLGELESLVSDLHKGGYSDTSIQPIVRPFDAFSGQGLASPWQVHKDTFAASLPVLLIIGETVPEDGPSLSANELQDLIDSVQKLRNEVSESTLPDEVKSFVFEQLEVIMTAIRDYPLMGAKAFKTAVREGLFHAGEHAEVVAEYKDTPVMTSLKQIQERVVKYAKYSVEVAKILGAWDSVYHHLQSAGMVVHQLASHVK
jgi:hypothetical protein